VAKIQAAAWGPGSGKIRDFETVTGQKFKNDLNVLAKVLVDYHPTYGLKVTVLDVDPNFTLGKIEQQRQETLQRLLTECADFIYKSGENYSTTNNRLSFPTVIQNIAIVTSSNSAGYQDFQHTLDNNSYEYKFQCDTYFTVVQGEHNAEQIHQRLLEVFQSEKNYDAVVILRGGGASTDFLIFDTFLLGKIVAKFPIPIITGIGHQKNETIVDLMAHSPTKTPTRAAELIIAHNRNFEERILRAQKNIIIKTQQLLSVNSQTLAYLHNTVIHSTRNLLQEHREQLQEYKSSTVNNTRSILFSNQRELMATANNLSVLPKITVQRKQQELRSVKDSLRVHKKNYFQNRSEQLRHFESMIRMMHPDNILKKGFAILMKDHKIISTSEHLHEGNELKIILSASEITTTITKIKSTDGKKTDVPGSL
jgi:exodeoxyribonuclease VII large subunit